eukprot:255068_1
MADSGKINSRDLFKTQTLDDDYHPMQDPDLDAVALSQLTKEQQSNQQEQIQRAKERYALPIAYCGGLNAIQSTDPIVDKHQTAKSNNLPNTIQTVGNEHDAKLKRNGINLGPLNDPSNEVIEKSILSTCKTWTK